MPLGTLSFVLMLCNSSQGLTIVTFAQDPLGKLKHDRLPSGKQPVTTTNCGQVRMSFLHSFLLLTVELTLCSAFASLFITQFSPLCKSFHNRSPSRHRTIGVTKLSLMPSRFFDAGKQCFDLYITNSSHVHASRLLLGFQ
jgi:hypothetical protein